MRELTINGLAELTGKEGRTIKKRLVGLAPIRADFYDSAAALPRIYEAEVQPGIAADKGRRIKAEADMAEIERGRIIGELVPTETMFALMEPIAIAIRQKILASDLSDSEKAELLTELVKLGEIDWVKEAKNALKRRG